MSGHDDIFSGPYAALDDQALLSHFCSQRGIFYYPVIDAQETSDAKIEGVMNGQFDFNGEIHTLPSPTDWLKNPSRDVEWHILLHKFYYAVGLGAAFCASGERRYLTRWVELVDSWIRVTPPGFIAADVTGRRVQNWIYSYYYFVSHAQRGGVQWIDAGFHRRFLRALFEQVEYLCANLTPKRNHRTLELHAIFLASLVFPEMRRASHWRELAIEQMSANMQSDLLADGVHCELSTDYHHLVLKNYLNFRRLAAANRIELPPGVDRHLQRALEFSLHVHKPDGTIPSFSDGDSRSFLDLLEYGATLFQRSDWLYAATQGRQGIPPSKRIAHFPVSGYSVVRSAWEPAGPSYKRAQHLVFDCGPLGEGNHGHFDALSFELAAFGRSLVVDPGRYTYSEAPDPETGTNWRLHFRGTAAHNTVCVDGLQQTRYEPKVIKAGTRHTTGAVRHKISGPPAQARLLENLHHPRLDILQARVVSNEYDATHDRCIVFVDRSYWIVSDRLRAPSQHHYRLNFQLGALAHGVTELIHSESHGKDAGIQIRSPNLLLVQPNRANIRTHISPGWVSEQYGHKQSAPAVQSHAHARNVDFDTVLCAWDTAEPEISVTDLEVGVGGTGQAMRGLRIAQVIDGQRVIDTWHCHQVEAQDLRSGSGFELRPRWTFRRQTDSGEMLIELSNHDTAAQPIVSDARTTQSLAPITESRV